MIPLIRAEVVREVSPLAEGGPKAAEGRQSTE